VPRGPARPGPGARPLAADPRILRAGAVPIGVYCPDETGAYESALEQLKTGDTVI
jgi:hypothetical protein